MKTIYLGGGCFWCTEAIYQHVQGVSEVIPGYMGGKVPNPSYETVSSGESGHAEVVKLSYDENVIGTRDILDIFFKTHDPTTLNKQGNDIGTQYRSIIFYTDEEQREESRKMIEKLKVLFPLDKSIVTEVVSASVFYPAESYHYNYYQNHRSAPYCQIIIDPKVEKLEREFKDKIR